MNFRQKWNKELQKIADEFFSKSSKALGIGYSEENLGARINEIFKTHEERKVFFAFLDDNYSLNIRTTYEYDSVYDLIYKIYIRNISGYFEKKGINTEYSTDFSLFKMYLSDPSRQLESHILKTIAKGNLFCANDEYVCIRWKGGGILTTDVIVAITENGYEIVSVYPGCSECNRNQDGVWYPDVFELGEKKQISVGANPFDFFDSFTVFEKDGFAEKLEPEYCYYAFAIAANVDFHTYLKETTLDCSYTGWDGVDDINPVFTIRTKLKELLEFSHLCKKFFMFKWNGYDNSDESCHFNEAVPVIIPARILPRGTELYEDDEIELQILLCGHQAVYMNPMEPKLESYKFDLVAALYGERKKSRAQIKQERIDWQYEFPETEGEIVEIKRKPAEYMIRIFDKSKPYEDQLIEQCRSFYEKNGVYPNMIVANEATFDRWLDSVEDNITDNIATDMKYTESEQPGLFDCLYEDEHPACGFEKDESSNCTVFATPDFKLFLVENNEIQDEVYEILNSYSPQLEKNSFMYPVVDAEATGKRIREVMDEKGITPTMIKKVLGGVSLQAIYKWFNGQALPRLDYFAVLSNMLNTPIDDLLVVDNQKRDKII